MDLSECCDKKNVIISNFSHVHCLHLDYNRNNQFIKKCACYIIPLRCFFIRTIWSLRKFFNVPINNYTLYLKKFEFFEVIFNIHVFSCSKQLKTVWKHFKFRHILWLIYCTPVYIKKKQYYGSTEEKRS